MMLDYLEIQGFRCLVEAVVDYLEASTKEIEARTALMVQDLAENVERAEKEQKRQEMLAEERKKQEQGQGMMRAPFGYCPTCGEEGVRRSRATNTDQCKNGHRYPSNAAVLQSREEADDNDH